MYKPNFLMVDIYLAKKYKKGGGEDHKVFSNLLG